jgi:hypothetical protein
MGITEKDPLQKEFHQAALEVLESLEPVINKYPPRYRSIEGTE